MQDYRGCLCQARLKPRYIKEAVGGFIGQFNPLDSVGLDLGLNGRDKGRFIGVWISRDEEGF